MNPPPSHPPREGQVWKDWDRRWRHEEPGGLVEILVVDEVTQTVLVQSLTEHPRFHTLPGKQMRIHFRRLRPNHSGFKLVKDVPT